VPQLRPYELSLDGRTIAVKLGIAHGDTFWAMVSSVDPEGIERMSPGEHALRRTIEECCKDGFAAIDMAAGDTGYKENWASEVVKLHSISRSLSLRGVIWSRSHTALAAGKKVIKNSEKLWPLAQKLRGTLLGTRNG
jgi:CelD/BcsL family acetyltransferase involved in cellulose biosynthesis